MECWSHEAAAREKVKERKFSREQGAWSKERETVNRYQLSENLGASPSSPNLSSAVAMLVERSGKNTAMVSFRPRRKPGEKSYRHQAHRKISPGVYPEPRRRSRDDIFIHERYARSDGIDGEELALERQTINA